jgi:hypothetical protein
LNKQCRLCAKDFDSTFVVQQMQAKGGKPFGVQYNIGSVQGGMGGVAFSNVGGDLNIQKVKFDNNNLMAIVSTGSGTTSGPGTTMLKDVSVASSTVMVCTRCVGAEWSRWSISSHQFVLLIGVRMCLSSCRAQIFKPRA